MGSSVRAVRIEAGVKRATESCSSLRTMIVFLLCATLLMFASARPAFNVDANDRPIIGESIIDFCLLFMISVYFKLTLGQLASHSAWRRLTAWFRSRRCFGPGGLGPGTGQNVVHRRLLRQVPGVGGGPSCSRYVSHVSGEPSCGTFHGESELKLCVFHFRQD